jgi:hypothetical protein
MILLYVLAAIAAFSLFAGTRRYGKGTRLALALAVFLVPSVIVTALVLAAGDPAPPGAVTVKP